MNLINWLDLLRLLAVLLALYFWLPARARAAGASGRPEYAPAFLLSSFFFVLAAVLLGAARWLNALTLLMAYAAWLGGTALVASRWAWFRRSGSGRFYRDWLRWLESGWPDARAALRWSPPPFIALSLAGTIALVLVHAWFPLANFRMVRGESYHLALSLASALHGEGSMPLAAAWIAPLAALSGASASSAQRFGGALAEPLLAFAAGWLVWRLTKQRPAAFAAAGASALARLVQAGHVSAEYEPASIAGALWLFAAAEIRRSPFASACGAAASLIVHPALPEPLATLLLLAVCAWILAGRINRLPAVIQAAGGVAALLAIPLLSWQAALRTPSDGPWQYEAAARAAISIQRNFRRNDWVVVSPSTEVAQTAGEGWHEELAAFVDRFTPEQAARPEFRFPYEAADIFVFVEKTPLPQAARQFASDPGPAPYYYSTAQGRAAMAFRAARLMAAYVQAHPRASVYYQDANLAVYRLPR